MMTAKAACETRGGELASIHSRDEAEFIYQMTNRDTEVNVQNLWIGLFRKGILFLFADILWEKLKVHQL